MRIVALLLVMACTPFSPLLSAEPTEIEIVADPQIYGEYPKNYKEIITQWLNSTLVDAPSAYVEWISPPKSGSLPEKKDGKALFGYVVETKVNSRNRFGTYTGMQKHTFLIHDGKVIKVTGFAF